MKTLYIILAIITLASCKKETPSTQTCNIKFYTRVECVELSGESTYSPISVITIK
jgi:hypothetical protein